MTDFPFDIVGFDLDGTLLDTSADLLAATNHALARVDRATLAPDRIKSMIGGGAKNMLKQGLHESGGYDDAVLVLNEQARAKMTGEVTLKVVPRATHLFEEPGALAQVADYAAAWFWATLKKSEVGSEK